jgi:GT2 family glycosyltransferase
MITWHLVTVAYNSAEALKRYWSDAELPPGIRWTVVDNASTDGSASIARRLGATVIELSENVGFGAANNIGAESAESQYVGFVNPDVRVDPASFIVAERLLVQWPNALVAPQLLSVDGQPQASGRGLPTIWAKILHRLSGAVQPNYEIYAPPGANRFVSWAMGAAILMRRPVYDSLLWDERFFVYYEDHDLGLRAWAAGNTVILAGSIRWMHGWARETTTLNVAAWRLELDGMIKFYTRYWHLLLPRPIASLWHPERRAIGKEPTSSACLPQVRSGD